MTRRRGAPGTRGPRSDLLERIAVLEARIAELERRPPPVQYHYHYPQWQYPYPSWQQTPYWQQPTWYTVSNQTATSGYLATVTGGSS